MPTFSGLCSHSSNVYSVHGSKNKRGRMAHSRSQQPEKYASVASCELHRTHTFFPMAREGFEDDLVAPQVSMAIHAFSCRAGDIAAKKHRAMSKSDLFITEVYNSKGRRRGPPLCGQIASQSHSPLCLSIPMGEHRTTHYGALNVCSIADLTLQSVSLAGCRTRAEGRNPHLQTGR